MKIIKSTTSNKVKKSNQDPKSISVRNGSQKNTARGSVQSQMAEKTPALISHKAAKNAGPLRSNIPTYRPPTASGPGTSQVTAPQIRSKRNIRSSKKSSVASIGEPSGSNFVSITSVNTTNPNERGLERAQHQYLVEQINHYKLTIKQKDKKVEKHKDYIGKLKNSLESVLAEHKRQAEQIENQKKELRALKCKMALH